MLCITTLKTIRKCIGIVPNVVSLAVILGNNVFQDVFVDISAIIVYTHIVISLNAQGKKQG